MFMQVVSPSTALWDQRNLFLVQRERSLRPWASLVDEGWTLVLPEWDPQKLPAALRNCRDERGLDPARTVIAGALDGAPHALRLAGEAGLPWMCIYPSFPGAFDPTPLTAVPRHTRGVFILAEEDREVVRLIAALQGAGVSVQTLRREPEGATLAVMASEGLRALPLD